MKSISGIRNMGLASSLWSRQAASAQPLAAKLDCGTQRYRIHPLRERKRVAARVYDVQPVKRERIQCRSHRSCHARCIGVFDFKPEASISVPYKEIEFRPGVQPPEVAVVPAQAEDLDVSMKSHTLTLQFHGAVPPTRPPQRTSVHLVKIHLGTRCVLGLPNASARPIRTGGGPMPAGTNTIGASKGQPSPCS